MAKDSWGRTILTHAVLSGRVEVFDAAFYALREEVLDYEVGLRSPLTACSTTLKPAKGPGLCVR